MTAQSPAMGLLSILKAVGGLTTGWTFAVGRLVPEPDKQIVLRHTGGRMGEVCVAIDYPSVQILCRGAPKGYDEAYQKLKAVREALVAIPSSVAYPELTSCVTIGDIVDLGYDDANRPQFAQNFQLIVSYATSGYRLL